MADVNQTRKLLYLSILKTSISRPCISPRSSLLDVLDEGHLRLKWQEGGGQLQNQELGRALRQCQRIGLETVGGRFTRVRYPRCLYRTHHIVGVT